MTGPAEADEAPDYRLFDLRCAHHELGYELGAEDPPFRTQAWWARSPSVAFAADCAAIVRELHAPLMDELAGYAEAQRIDVRELWRHCCRVNLKARVRAHPGDQAEGPGEGCSTFVWRGTDFAIAGRNYDYHRGQARRQRIRFEPVGDAYASIGARGSVPCGRYDGINDHGVWASLHVVMTDTPADDEVRPGVPFHLVSRLALDLCRSAREARDLLANIPHLSSLNYLVADRHEAFVIEADPRRVRVLALSPSETIVATNHFRHPDMQPLQGQRPLANSNDRCAFLGRGPSHEARPSEAMATAERALADGSVPVCGQTGWLTTLWSAVADLNTGRIRYAPGAPDRTAYEELPPLVRRD